MCGRFAARLPPELLGRVFAAVGDIPNTPPSWNVAPTKAALVVRRHPDRGGAVAGCPALGTGAAFHQGSESLQAT